MKVGVTASSACRLLALLSLDSGERATGEEVSDRVVERPLRHQGIKLVEPNRRSAVERRQLVARMLPMEMASRSNRERGSTRGSEGWRVGAHDGGQR
ncbi:hypothetical protein E2562_039425 [Oryza meyeriana var. granulata]|uniref:Secreted protein n=1 Tax=Oryza meyeriana var. granulata TaxID=110450 RepID=A0A6G1CY14_9ORYZ|nr:hypothetical protein E2562_039425 [Oryza meyeriana var. granulata]